MDAKHIEAVIRRHRLYTWNQVWTCNCGWTSKDPVLDHPAHLTERIVETRL